jgi:hypothetical protein
MVGVACLRSADLAVVVAPCPLVKGHGAHDGVRTTPVMPASARPPIELRKATPPSGSEKTAGARTALTCRGQRHNYSKQVNRRDPERLGRRRPHSQLDIDAR